MDDGFGVDVTDYHEDKEDDGDCVGGGCEDAKEGK